MTVRVEGRLKTPLNTPAANIPIKIITTIGAGETLSSAEVTHVTDDEGNYGFDLVYATHEIYAMFEDTFELIGMSVANETVPTPATINELLHFSTPIQPEIVDQIYSDVYGCIGELESDINTCTTQLSEQVVQGDTGVRQDMTVYTNECLQACSAELTTAIQAGDAQTLSQSQAYTDATGMEIACCTELLSTGLSEVCTTMTSITEANGTAIADVRTDMEAGDAVISQQAHAYTDACTGIVEANIVNFVEACNASVYECMFAINCCIIEIDENSGKIWYEAEPPTSKANVGDVWYDIDDGNEPYYFTSQSLWESLRDTSISAAQADADAAQAAADLACICSCAYADGVVSAEEARAIADAQAKADAAQANAIAASDTKGSAAAAELAACNYADANFVDSVTYGTDIAEIQQQLDKSITSWFGDATPTTDNFPAVDWTTDEAKALHLGDLYYDNDDGLSYRWSQDASVYLWVRVVDSGIEAALAAASAAQDTADQKRRVFFGTPVPPYDKGDLWDTGEGLRRADVISTTTFSEGHWVWATDAKGAAASAELAACNYVVAQVNLEEIRANAYADGVADAAELAAICSAEAAAQTAEMNAKLYADGCLTQSELEIQAAYTAYSDAAEAAAIVTSNAYADGITTEAELAAICAANACTEAAEVRANAYADGIVTASEQAAIDASKEYADAQDAVNKLTTEAYADGIVSEEEARAIADAQEKADIAEANAIAASDPKGCAAAAQQAAKEYTDAQDVLLQTTTEAYADGVADAAELAAICSAEACVCAAEVRSNAYADGIVTASEQAAIDTSKAYADAQDALAKTVAEAYADGVATEAELAAIAAAEEDVAVAEARMRNEMDNKDSACNTKIVACTTGLTGAIELLECDICDVSQGVELQQSGYEIVTSAGDAEASISLLATSYSNSDVQCSEILMQADKITMHNGDATNGSHPFYVEGNKVYMDNAYIRELTGDKIASNTQVIAGIPNATTYTINVSGTYGVGYNYTDDNVTPAPFLIRGLAVKWFIYSDTYKKTILTYQNGVVPADTSMLTLNVGGVVYTLYWVEANNQFETQYEYTRAFLDSDIGRDVLVFDGNTTEGTPTGVAGMNGNDEGTSTRNPYKNIRFWGGTDTPLNASGDIQAPFSVDNTGKLRAKNADIDGHINAQTLTFVDGSIPPEIDNNNISVAPYDDTWLYPDQSQLQISGGGYSENPANGWGIHESGLAVFNDGVRLNNAALQGGVIHGARIVAEQTYLAVDAAGDGGTEYYLGHTGDPIYAIFCQYSLSQAKQYFWTPKGHWVGKTTLITPAYDAHLPIIDLRPRVTPLPEGTFYGNINRIVRSSSKIDYQFAFSLLDRNGSVIYRRTYYNPIWDTPSVTYRPFTNVTYTDEEGQVKTGGCDLGFKWTFNKNSDEGSHTPTMRSVASNFGWEGMPAVGGIKFELLIKNVSGSNIDGYLSGMTLNNFEESI